MSGCGGGWGTAVTVPGIAFSVLDGNQAAARAPDFLALHAEVYAGQPYSAAPDTNDVFARRFGVQCRQPGFLLTQRHGDYLVGYGFGMPLRSSTDWWRDLTTALTADLTTEYAGRTFALGGLVVRAPWRRQHIGETMHDLIIAGRPEERAASAVWPAATAAQAACAAWGWRKVGRKRDQSSGALLDLVLRQLP